MDGQHRYSSDQSCLESEFPTPPMTKTYSVTAQVWLYPGQAAWHFMTLPAELALDIEYHFGHLKKGWGSLPVEVKCRQVVWQTSLFPDKKSDSYLLPLKAQARRETNIKEGDTVEFHITLSTSPL